jgi:(2R)-3-sulfolactate dehydrogenase (NADP+)
VARAVARAEETGNVICGLYYLESYCVQLLSGRVDGTVEPEVRAPRRVRPGGRALRLRPTGLRPRPAEALEAARENGVATLAVAHSHTCTSLGFFTEQIAAEGLIALGMTNASAIVAGPGGQTPVLGTNPFAITIPGPTARRCMRISRPPPWRLAGSPWPRPRGRRSPRAGRWMPTASHDRPRGGAFGALQSAAGHKGWALGLMVEAFAAGLTGSVLARREGAEGRRGARPTVWGSSTS